MPVKAPPKLPAVKQLLQENIFVMTEERAVSQDIRPLKIAILNLMPTKEVTESQLLRLISNSPLQVEVVLLHTATYESSNTSAEHLSLFYKTFDEVAHERFDGLVVTGAPIEQLEFSEVRYWDELSKILTWADENVYSSLYICWAAQAALYHLFGITKHRMDRKISGIFAHRIPNPNNPIVRGFDDGFSAPHSRHTEIFREDILRVPELEILAESDEAGVYLAATKDLRHVFVTGHGEYDSDTLHKEYMRDLQKGLSDIGVPKHYYIDDVVGRVPSISWRAHSMLLFMNWLNYGVYQETPFEFTSSAGKK